MATRYIYSITEYGYTIAHVAFAWAISLDEQQTLKACLEKARHDARLRNTDNDMRDILAEAADRFTEKTGRHLTIVDNPIKGDISF